MKNRKQAYHIETEKGLINDPNGEKQPLKTLFIGVSLLSHYKRLKLMTRMERIQEVQSVMVRHYLFIIREM